MKEITQDQRDKLHHFNTVKYWHCWYDEKTNKMYDEYCNRISEPDPKQYLIDAGMIDENNKVLRYFEE